jgi:hypothetical protein
LNQTLKQYLRFYANYGYNPPTTVQIGKVTEISKKARIQAEQLKGLHEQLRLDIKFLAQRTSIYYNKKRLKGPRFREENKVYLIKRNMRITRSSEKLDYKKFGPFKIIRYIKSTNFKL